MTGDRYEKNNTAFIAVNCNNNQSVTLISADVFRMARISTGTCV